MKKKILIPIIILAVILILAGVYLDIWPLIL